MSLLNQECIYCIPGISTRNGDHVPPQGFFPEKRGHELIKVPCCESCNNEHSKFDGYIRNVITAEEHSGNHITVLDELDNKRERSWDRDNTLFEKQVKILSIEERVMADGTKTLWPTMIITETEFDNFFRRMTLALLYKENNLYRSPNSKVSWGASESLASEVKKELDKIIFRNSIRTLGKGEFQYCGACVAKSSISFWWMKFYYGAEIYTWIKEDPNS